MTGVAAGMLLQVILMLLFGRPPFRKRFQGSNYLSGIQSGFIGSRYKFPGRLKLSLAFIENSAAVTAAYIVALAVKCGRIMDAEEVVQDTSVGSLSIVISY